jgi:enoyl-CoA hydratase
MKAIEHGPIVAMQEFMSVQQRLSQSLDAAEGVASFVERRPARFKGQ